jgi:hypothetical protein
MRRTIGQRSGFLQDVWCGEQLLKISYSDLYSIAWCKDVWVADHMLLWNGSIQWNIFFTRPVHDWEVDLVSSFLRMLYSLRVRQGDADKICWIPSKGNKFEVRSYY